MDAEYLALIADAIGKPGDARAYRQERAAMIQRINDKLWNEELGVYCSRYWDEDGKPGAFLTRLTPMNFYPLIAGVPDSSRSGRVLKLMTDPKKFWGQWVLPTLPYDDPLWPTQNYWKGKVWAPVNYLVFQGLKRYASPELQAEFARKSVDIFMRNWTAKRVCGENYLSTTGDQSSDPHYTWGALMCLIGLESIVDVDNDGQVKTGRGFTVNIELNHIPLQGQLRRINVKNGRVVIQ
jgi:neutral trehalase